LHTESFGHVKKNILSSVVFLITLVVVLLSLVSVVFPALFVRTLGGFKDNFGIDPFTIGTWAYPFLIVNIVLFALGFLYFKHKLPTLISKRIRFIFNFEISPQVASIIIMLTFGGYIIFTVRDLFNGNFEPDYYLRVKSWLENYNIANLNSLDNHLSLFLEVVSMKIFGNYKVIPYIGSIALLLLTYFITTELAKKRFAGIVAMAIVLQSNIFLTYASSVSYPNFWILFYLLSLYLINKKWPLSSISYVAASLSKGLAAMFLPMTLLFIYRSDMPIQKKIRLVNSYIIIITIGVALLVVTGATLHSLNLQFKPHDFWMGFSSVSSALRLDGLILLTLLPLTVGLFVMSRKGIVQADSILFLIMGILLSAPFLPGLSPIINVPYRFIPLVVFFAMGAGVMLSKRTR
jgi:hypothetical protein